MQDDLALEQVVDFPTRDGNTLDLLFTSHPSLVDKCKPLPSLGKSDHETILVDLSLTAITTKSNRRKIFLWDKADKTAIEEKIKSMSNNILCNYTEITSIIDKLVPSKLSRSRHMTHVDEVICGDINNNPKRFWTYLNSKRQDSQGVAPITKRDGILHSDTENKAEVLNEQFHSVYTEENLTSLPNKGRSPHPTMPRIAVNLIGVHTLLTNIRVHKSTGADEVPARLLHDISILYRLQKTK